MPTHAVSASTFPRLLFGAVLTVGSVACEPAPPRQAASIISDSAGVRLVTSRRAAWADEDLPGWRIPITPILSIGTREGDAGQQLFQVRDAARGPDGAVAIVNGGTAEVRLYGADGRLEAILARQGDGPGEVQAPWQVDWLGGDTLRIWDAREWRLQHRLRNGTLLSDERVDRSPLLATLTPGFLLGMVRVLPDGSLLAATNPWTPPDTPRGEAFRPTVAYFLGHPTLRAQWDTLVLVAGAEQVLVDAVGPMGAVPLFPPQSPGQVASVAMGPDGAVCLGDQVGWSISCFRDGRETKTRWAGESVPVAPEEVAVWRAERARVMERMIGPGIRTVLGDVPIPAHRPPYDRLVVDALGHLWVRHPRSLIPSDGPDRYTILDPQRVWLGEVSVPPLELLEVGEDYLTGVSRDHLGVEVLQVYELLR